MKKVLTLLAAAVLSISFIQAGNYSVNDAAVDALIDNATEMSLVEVADNTSELNVLSPITAPIEGAAVKEKSAVIAFALAWLFGSLGIHRWYLGSSIGTYVVYCLTGGGFGCLLMVDWIMLLIEVIKGEGKIDTYSDNDKLFMWKS